MKMNSKVSRSTEFFPGTQDRVILLSGSVNAILTALHMILSKLIMDEQLAHDAPPREQLEGGMRLASVQLVVPNGACGAIFNFLLIFF